MRLRGRRFAWLAVLALVGCATPGGIYRDYEGPEKERGQIAVLTWTGPVVTDIDGRDVHTPYTDSSGKRITIAHLLPGQHVVRIRHDWEDLYYQDPEHEYLDLEADIEAGKSYRVQEAPCKNCDPFSVVFWIANDVTGLPLIQ